MAHHPQYGQLKQTSLKFSTFNRDSGTHESATFKIGVHIGKLKGYEVLHAKVMNSFSMVNNNKRYLYFLSAGGVVTKWDFLLWLQTYSASLTGVAMDRYNVSMNMIPIAATGVTMTVGANTYYFEVNDDFARTPRLKLHRDTGVATWRVWCSAKLKDSVHRLFGFADSETTTLIATAYQIPENAALIDGDASFTDFSDKMKMYPEGVTVQTSLGYQGSNQNYFSNNTLIPVFNNNDKTYVEFQQQLREELDNPLSNINEITFEIKDCDNVGVIQMHQLPHYYEIALYHYD